MDASDKIVVVTLADNTTPLVVARGGDVDVPQSFLPDVQAACNANRKIATRQ